MLQPSHHQPASSTVSATSNESLPILLGHWVQVVLVCFAVQTNLFKEKKVILFCLSRYKTVNLKLLVQGGAQTLSLGPGRERNKSAQGWEVNPANNPLPKFGSFKHSNVLLFIHQVNFFFLQTWGAHFKQKLGTILFSSFSSGTTLLWLVLMGWLFTF